MKYMSHLPNTRRSVQPRFGAKQCPKCVSNHIPTCSICSGTGWVTVPVGLYAQVISRQIRRGAIP